MQSDKETATFLEFFEKLKRLVYKRFRYHKDKDNLIGVGSVSLLTAIRRFDPGRGIPFWGFASKVIVRDLVRFIEQEDKTESIHESVVDSSRHTRLFR